MNISEIEQELTQALKSRDVVTASTLRLLLSRLKNERIAVGKELNADEVIAIVQSEYKKRKEAATEFSKGDRGELAEKEMAEAAILEKFLPPQASESDIEKTVVELLGANAWTSKDFGVAMKMLKEQFGASADGALLAKVLKAKLN